MKYKLLAVSTVPAINIGDYVQALASSQFYPRVDGFIEREHLKEYEGEESRVIMNAYYMHDGKHWPPSDKIDPLFVSTHINSLVRKDFESQESMDYMIKHAPFGCRDYDTKAFLENNGIDAYFSGCMTLTLGQKYKWEGPREGVYFVDPKVTFKNRLEKTFYYIISFINNNVIKKIAKEYYHTTAISANERSILSKFYIKYQKLFTKDTLKNAHYVNQESSYYNDTFKNNQELLEEAERLIVMYSKAALVVTSRIHCGLPCLGLETPVLLINNGEQLESSSCRLRGLRELFNVLNWTHNGIEATFSIVGMINENNHPSNKNDWRPLAKDLINRCQLFMNK